MSDKIKDFLTEKAKRQSINGELQFVLCPECQAEIPHFAPVVGFGQDGKPFIAALVCLSDECNGDTDIAVVNGYLE